MSYLALTDADREAMLETIGVATVEELFADLPAGVRLGRELELAPAMSEQELNAYFESLAAENAHVGEELSFLGAGHVRPLRAGDRRRRAPARRVPDRVHAVPARAQPGRAAGDLRVPDRDLRADRHGRLERVRLRRDDGRRGCLLHRQARDRPLEGRRHRGDQPAGAPGREDLRARLRARGRRGAAPRRRDRPGRATRGRDRRGLRDLPAPELLRRARAGARAGGRRERRGGPAGRPRRPALARRARGAGQLRLRDRDRRRAGGRQLPLLRRAALRLPGGTLRLHPPHAGADRRRDDRRGGEPRLRPHPADARAAHPAREGDLEHHHQPDAAGAGRARLPVVARAGRPPRGRRDLHGARGAREGAARAPARVWRPADVQGVRGARRAAGAGGRPRRPRARRPSRLRRSAATTRAWTTCCSSR